MTPNQSRRADPVSRTSLPIAAQRWLDKALPSDHNLPACVRLDQEGSMEIRGTWTPFTASGVYRAPPLSFNWRARFRLLPGVWIVAEDGHLDGQGWGGARLWGVIPMGKRTDPEVLTSQLVRSLGELPWVPALALADPSLTWADAGETAFEIRSSAGDREVVVRYEVDDRGDVVRAYSPARPYDVPGGYEEAPWHYAFSDHREFAGTRIPATGVATFEKGDGPWEYLRAGITAVTFGT